MVAGTGHDTRLQDRRYSFYSGPTYRARNSKSCAPASSLLAYITIRQFYSVRAIESALNGHPNSLRTCDRGCCWNDPRIGARIRRTSAGFATAVLQAEARNETAG